jgi:hypothetical protein
MTISIGVMTRLPSTRAMISTPCHSWVAGNRRSTQASSRFSSKSSSLLSPWVASFTAV